MVGCEPVKKVWRRGSDERRPFAGAAYCRGSASGGRPRTSGRSLAERTGFEPVIGLLTLWRFSKPLVSATHPPLRERSGRPMLVDTLREANQRPRALHARWVSAGAPGAAYCCGPASVGRLSHSPTWLSAAGVRSANGGRELQNRGLSLACYGMACDFPDQRPRALHARWVSAGAPGAAYCCGPASVGRLSHSPTWLSAAGVRSANGGRERRNRGTSKPLTQLPGMAITGGHGPSARATGCAESKKRVIGWLS